MIRKTSLCVVSLLLSLPIACSREEFQSPAGAGGAAGNAGVAGSASGGIGASQSGGSAGVGASAGAMTGGTGGDSGGSAGTGGIGVSGAAGTGGSGGTLQETRVIVESSVSNYRRVPSADVVVSDANGAMVGRFTTNANGEVDVPLPDGGAVSAFKEIDYTEIDGVRYHYRVASTVTSVHLGTDLYVPLFYFEPEPQPERPERMTLTLNLTTTEPQPDDAVFYYIGCTRSAFLVPGGTATETLRVEPCEGESTFDLWTFVSRGGVVTRYGVQLDQPFVAGGAATIALAADRQTISQHTFNVGPIPSDATNLTVSIGASRPARDTSLGQWTVLTPPGPAETIKLPMPVEPFEETRTSMSLHFGSTTRIYTVRHGMVAPHQLEWDPLRLVARFEAGSHLSFNADSPIATWKLGAGGIGDAITVSYRMNDTGSGVIIWDVAGPASDAGQLVPPELPADLKALVQLDEASTGVIFRNYDAIWSSGYRELLATSGAEHEKNYNLSTAVIVAGGSL